MYVPPGNEGAAGAAGEGTFTFQGDSTILFHSLMGEEEDEALLGGVFGNERGFE